MGVAAELDAMERLADIVGWRAALMLSAWAGGRNLSIPARATDRHVIARLIGLDAFERLVGDGRMLVAIPSCDLSAVRTRGQVYRLSAQGVSSSQIADLLGVSARSVQRHARALAGTGRFFELDGQPEQLGPTPGSDRRKRPALPAAPTPAPTAAPEARRVSRENEPRELAPRPRASPAEVIAALEAERIARACAALRDEPLPPGV